MSVLRTNLLNNVICAVTVLACDVLPRAVVIFSFASAAVAAQAEVDPFRSLLKARSSAELRREVTNQKRLQRQQLVCEAQLKLGKIPSACFQVLKFESESDVIPASHLPWLEELCEKRVKLSKDWRELDDALLHGELPQICQRAARLRLDDLKYAAQTENPAELFKRRFADRNSGDSAR
jgi:hypothetical protein